MATAHEHVNEVHFGHTEVLSEKRTMRFHFHGYTKLVVLAGNRARAGLTSPPLPCLGHMWSLSFLPSYGEDNNRFIGLSLCLSCCDSEEIRKNPITVECQFRSPGFPGLPACSVVFNRENPNFCIPWRRRDLDDDGTFTIDVDLQVSSKVYPLGVWKPSIIPEHDMLEMLRSGEFSDVTFAVGERKFPAHRTIIAKRAPLLVELSKNATGGEAIPIDGVDACHFEALLHFVYTGSLPATLDTQENPTAMLIVADKFGCTILKLLEESKLVASGITVDNVCELLLLADALSCALLKEAAIRFYISFRHRVVETEGYINLLESNTVTSELFHAMQFGVDGSVCVANLRRELEKLRLEVDGTRDMLVSRLNGAQNKENFE